MFSIKQVSYRISRFITRQYHYHRIRRIARKARKAQRDKETFYLGL